MARTNQIQVRRGTATQWSNTNPVLASGEPGFDTTNSLLKVGDGTSTWSSLSSNVGVGDAGLLSIAGLTTASGSYLFATANDVYTTGISTVYGRSVLAASGVESLVTTTLTAGTGILLSYNSGTDTVTISTSGLVIGTNVQAYDAGLTSIAGLTTASGSYIYATANDVYTTGVITSFGRSLVDDADATTARTTLGLGTLATQSGTFSGTSSGTNTGDQTLPTAASLNLTVGTYTQAYDAGLTSIAGLTTASGSYIYATANDVYTTGISTVYGRSVLAASGISSVLTTALTAGTGILLSYNSGTDTATINTSGLVIGTNVQAYDAGLTSIAGLTTASGNYLYATANDVYTTGVITAFGRSLVDDADAATSRTTLGLALGTDVQAYSVKLAQFIALVHSYGGFLISDGTNWNVNTPSSARSQLSLVVGTDVQAYDAGLLSIAGLTTAADRYIYTTANDVYTTGTITTFGRSLVDDADASTARTTLGLVIGTDVSPVSNPTFTGVVTTAGQIAFPATVNLSAGANTLDDYEEGTWTPTFTATTTNPTVTYDAAIRYGVYVKIGKTVFISGTVVITALTAAGSGNLQISGLPFTASSGTTGGYGSLTIGYKASWTTTTPSTAYVQASATYIQLGNEAMTATITTANLSAASYIQFSGFYNTTS